MKTETAPAPSVTPTPAPSPSIADQLESLVGENVTGSCGPILLCGRLQRRVSDTLKGWFEIKASARTPHWVDCAFPPDWVRRVDTSEPDAMIFFK